MSKKRSSATLDHYLTGPPTKKARVTRVAIIGTAGRGKEPMTLALFDAMVQAARETMTHTLGLDPKECQLVSGGAAWADHVAVALFLQGDVAGLTIYAPCAFVGAAAGFEDTGAADWRINPGKSANHYHARFSKAVKRDTLAEIAAAQQQGARISVGHTAAKGFHARNKSIAAAATHMIAFSWGEGPAPSDGGTAHTWNQCKLDSTYKKHIGLRQLIVSHGH